MESNQDSVRIKKFVDSSKWIFARTYAKTAPHEYLIYDNLDAGNQKEYLWVLELINKNGVEGKFYQTVFKYFYFGEYKYWLCDTDTRRNGVMNRDNRTKNYTQ